jgi:hypothetical protein
MTNSENPYASPSAMPDFSKRDLFRHRIRPPALGLVILGSLMLLSIVALITNDVFWNLMGRSQYAETRIDWWKDYWLPFALSAVGSGVGIYGGILMLRLRHFRICVAAAVASLIPCFSAFGLLGIPFGAWALFVLWQKHTRAAFAETA